MITSLRIRAVKWSALVLSLLLIAGCEKENGQIGRGTIIGLPPGVDSIHLNIVSFTQDVDSVLVALDYDRQKTLGGYVGSRLAGSMEDVFIGKAEAGIITQLIPTQLNIDFGDNPVVDSVKLFMRYAGIYGDSSKSMSFEFHELTEDLSRDSNFHSGYVPVLGEKLGENLNFTPRVKSSVVYDGDTINPVLISNLDANYFQMNFANVANGSNSNFADFDDFINYFKGIYVKSVNSDGSILYFNMASTESKIVISYHNDNDTSEAVFNFAQDKSSLPIGFSIFNQDYTAAAFDVNNPDSLGKGAETTYTQAMGGVATVLKIPELFNRLETGSVVNRAFIEVPTQRGLGSSLASAASLEIRKMTSKGPATAVRDFLFDGSRTGDGALRLGEFRNNRYLFEVTEYIFEALNDQTNPNLAVVPVNRSTTANRAILKGGNDPLDPIKLIIYYTKP